MMGRAVLVLCMLVGVAHACPIRFHSEAERAEFGRWYVKMRTADAAATMQLGPAASSDNSPGVAIALALMGLCGVAFVITRANAVRRTFATSHHLATADLELVQAVARRQRTRTTLFAAACAGVLPVILSVPMALEARAVLAVAPAMLFALAVVALCRLELLLGLHHEPTLRVLSHGHHLFVARGKRLVGWVAAPPGLVARASGLPVATLRH